MLYLIFLVYVANKRMHSRNHRPVSGACSLLQKVGERLALRQLFCCCRSDLHNELDAESACEVNGVKRTIASKLHGETPYLTNRICHIESWVLTPVSGKDLSTLFLSEKGMFLLT